MWAARESLESFIFLFNRDFSMWFSFLAAEGHTEILHLSATHPHTVLLLSQQMLPKGYREAQGDHPWLKLGGFHPGCCLPPHWGASLRCQDVFSNPQKLML